MKLSLRPLLLLLALVLIFSVGMASLLNYFKFESTVKKLQRDRIGLIADEVQKAVERSSSLGGELASNPTIQAMIERQLKSDSLVTLIDIFDAKGKILFSTDVVRIHSSAPAAWISAAYRMKAREWFLAEKSAFITGSALKNSFDLTIGSVAVRYDRHQFDRNVFDMGKYIGTVGLTGVTGAFVLCGLMFVFFSMLMRQDVAEAEHLLGEGSPGLPAATCIGREIQALKKAAIAAEGELSAIDQMLQKTWKK